MNENGGDPNSYAMASGILNSSLNLPDVSDAMAKAIQQGQSTYAIGQVTAMAMNPRTDRGQFIPAYQSLMNSVMEDMNSNCRMQLNQQGCMQSQRNYQSVMTIPQVMNQTQQQQQQLMLQQSSMFSSPMGGLNALNPGLNGIGMPGMQGGGLSRF